MAAKHGGSRAGAGRPAGAKNRATLAAKKTFAELARDYSEEALRIAVEIMRDPEASPSARMAAVNAVMDRGYGKPTQAVEMSGADGGPVVMVTRRIVDPDGTDDRDAPVG